MKYHIVTYGCQMNKNDSERIESLLDLSGHQKDSENNADVVIINACSVRGRVVDKIMGKVNNLSKDKTLILTGCVLPKDKPKLIDKFDHILDVEDLPLWGKKLNFLKSFEKDDYFSIKAERKKPIAHVPIMTGCDNFCSYCAVPYVRGRERSRPVEEILKEVKHLIEKDFKEIWLLGQNVNSYNKGNSPDFSDLLVEINQIPGDFWIRFTSSHPKDFSKKLIKAMKECDKVPEYLNLPLQSGDNDVLKLMNRPYTREDYLRIVNDLRKELPEITISTDVIVGFPGETEKAFKNTLKLFEEVRFDMAYIARFSPRPHTKAAKMEEIIPEEVKKEREKALTEVLKKTALEKNKKKIGKKIRYLTLKYEDGIDIGKTSCYKTIKVASSDKDIGNFKKAKIINANHFGLEGALL